MRPQEPPQTAPRRVTLADPRVTQPSLQRSYLVPSYTTAKPGEAEALDVLAHILGGGSNSRLYRALVMEQRVATSAGAWYKGTALDRPRFGVYGAPRPGVALRQARRRDRCGDRRGRSTRASPPKNSSAPRAGMIADAIYAQDSQATLARWYGAALTTGRRSRTCRRWPERMRAVTAEHVRDAARRWLDKRRSVTGYLVKDEPAREEKRS